MFLNEQSWVLSVVLDNRLVLINTCKRPFFLLPGLLVDVFHDYKYLFFMCGSIILTGGLFLLIMNIYNYHQLHKEEAAKDPEQKQEDSENQDQVVKQTSQNVTEQAEPKADTDAGGQKSSD